jgi:hypothetical protein
MYEFIEEDLKFNKRGSISLGQKEWLRRTARGVRSFSWTNAFIAVGFMFLGLCIVLALYLQNEDSRAALFSKPINLIVLPVTILAVTAILAFSILFARRQAYKLENAVLSSASGNIRFDRDSSGESGITSYYVFVGKKRFTFGDEMSAVFKEGEKYKVYYRKSGIYEFVLSLEQVSNQSSHY